MRLIPGDAIEDPRDGHEGRMLPIRKTRKTVVGRALRAKQRPAIIAIHGCGLPYFVEEMKHHVEVMRADNIEPDDWACLIEQLLCDGSLVGWR